MTRFFAYCEAKGCRAAKPFRWDDMLGGKPVVRTATGPVNLADVAYFRPAGSEAPMREADLWCEGHGPMRVQGVRAKYNPEKVCDARCTGAKRASCDCSCRGENHGASF